MADINQDLALYSLIKKKTPRLALKSIKTLNFKLRRGPFVFKTDEQSNYGLLIKAHRKHNHFMKATVYTRDFDFYK